MLQVFQDFVLRWPGLPRRGEAQPVVARSPLQAEPDVKRSHLCLQPRRFVRLRKPGGAANTIVPVEHHEVSVAVVEPINRMLDAVVSCPNDRRGVGILAAPRLERQDALDGGPAGHLGGVLEDHPTTALLDDEDERFWICERLVRQRHLDICNGRACLYGKRHRLVGAENREGALPEARTPQGRGLDNIAIPPPPGCSMQDRKRASL
mmetsp:Transcript_100486/g.324025  ORF Transcript_100486/g.324025 Transcript_100486/m.324025 type:complete len:207 (-) Transcript_100486:212-832(-)